MSLFCTAVMTCSRRSGMSSTTISTTLGFEPASTGAALATRGGRPAALKAMPATAPSLRASLRVIGVSIRYLLCLPSYCPDKCTPTSFTLLHVYPAPQHVVLTGTRRAGTQGAIPVRMAPTIQDAGFDFPRIILLDRSAS